MTTTNDEMGAGADHGQSGDAGIEPPREYAWPTPEWIAAYRAESTPATMGAAARCAEVELLHIDTSALGLGALGPDDLVQYVLISTLNGTLHWPAGRITLRAHLRDKIRKHARRLRKHVTPDLTRAPVPLDDLVADSPVWLDERLHAGGDVCEQLDVAAVSRVVERALTKRLHRDPLALRVLAAMPEAITIAEIAEATGLDAKVVRAAKLRIQRAAVKLDRSIREAAREVLAVPPLTHDASDLSRSHDSEP